MNGYIHNREELKPIHDEVASWAERSFVIGGIAHHKQQDLEQRIAKHVDPMLARIKELEEALRGMVEWFEMKRKSAPVDNARAILNKKP